MKRAIPFPAKKGGLWGRFWALWIRWAFPRQFAALHVASKAGLEAARPLPPGSVPTLFYANHCGWWDGFVAKLVMEDILGYEGYLPMEEVNLRRFPSMTRLGAFGLNRANPREALAALRWVEDHIRDHPKRALWIFPQGALLPQDIRPLTLESGAALVASGLKARIIPVACRYEFRDLAKPEVFVLLGEPVIADAPRRALNQAMGDTLEALVDELRDTIAQDAFDRAHPLIAGTRGVDAIWEAIKATFRRGLPPPAP